MLRSRNRLRRFGRSTSRGFGRQAWRGGFRHNPQMPVWDKPLFSADSPVWRGPLFRNPDEELDIEEEFVAPDAPASRRYFRNPQPPVWQQPLWTADSPVWRGPLFRNPEELEHELDAEVIPASRRHFRRRNPAVGASLQPQAPVWKGPLWTNDSPVWRGPLFRNPDEDGSDDFAPAPLTPASRRYFRRRNPQPPVWQAPLFTDNSAVWRGPLFRNPDEETCEICNLRKNPYRRNG